MTGNGDREFMNPKFSGTMVVKGQGIAQVRSTGVRTEIGKIGKALQVLQPEDTNLQRQTSKIVRNFAILGLSLCTLVIIAYGLTRDDWLTGLLARKTLGHVACLALSGRPGESHRGQGSAGSHCGPVSL